MAQNQTDDRLLASPFLFRFAVPCFHHAATWSKMGIQLSEKYALPCFAQLDQPKSEGVAAWAEVRAAWNTAGIVLNLRVTGKRQPPWCRASRVEDSDGMAVWINTRNTSEIHRAGRFCHEFRLLPVGGGAKMREPMARQMTIRRAKENAVIDEASPPQIRSECRVHDYLIEAFIPATAMTGYDPDEHSQLGFHYVVSDQEMGQHVMTLGEPFPTDSDPSLWSTLDLVDK